MTIQPILETLANQLNQRLRVKVPHGRRAPEDLRPALQRESIRADRTGHTFCWVLFSLDRQGSTKRTLHRLFHLIARRARLTDEVGSYDETSVGVILPVTDHGGAAHFAREIIGLAAELGIYPRAAVHSYPNDSPPKDGVSTKVSSTSHPMNEDRRGMSNVLSFRTAQANFQQVEPCVIEPFLTRSMPWGKRVSDIVVAGLGLLLVFPVLLVAAIAVRLSSPGPVFFGQKRAGLGGRPFVMYKFRSMYADAEARKEELMHLNEQDGPAFKIKNDPRITPVGRILRSTSIDELPQLFNVLKGDMSLVGPRPPTFDEVAKYRSWFRRRLQISPGITCIWQVYGRSQVSFEEWMRMDMQYIKDYGPWLDLKLILNTIPAVLFRQGAR